MYLTQGNVATIARKTHDSKEDVFNEQSICSYRSQTLVPLQNANLPSI